MDTKLKTLLLLLVVLKETRAAPPCDGDCSTACSCYGKNLLKVPHNMPTSMTAFRLQENRISSLGKRDFSSKNLLKVPHNMPTSMTAFRLQENRISTLGKRDFSRYSKLEEIYLYDNSIRSIQVGTFSPVPHLLVLYLSSNHLSTLPQGLFHGLDQLQSLYLSHNRIEDVPSFSVTDLPKLEFLSLGNNGIYSISPDAFINLPSLKYLFLGNNKLTEIPTVDMQLPTLATLFLYNNSIWEIPDNAFWNQPNLVTLYLDTNKIYHIAPKAFRGLDKLNRLFLFGNQITDLPDSVFFGLSNLEVIRLQDNQISQVHANTFAGITRLEYLFLDYNNIREFPIEALSNVEIDELGMSNNQMETLSPEVYDILSDVNWKGFVENNPWHCDCNMIPFRQKINLSFVFDNYLSYQMTCNSPGKFYGKRLTDIDPEDLTCDNATSVVLGILFAILIIVAIVLVVRYRRRASKNVPSHQRSTLASNTLTRNTLTRNTLTRNTLTRNTLTRNTLIRNTLTRNNAPVGRGAAQGPGRAYGRSKPPTRPPPPRAVGGRGAQGGSVGRGAGGGNQQSFARQHNQFDPHKDRGRSGPPSRPPPPLSPKGMGPETSNTDSHKGATGRGQPPRPTFAPGQRSQSNLYSNSAFGHVHKPVATSSTPARKQGAKKSLFGFINPNKESATSDHQTQRIEAGKQNRFDSSGSKLSRHTSLAKCLPPSQPPPPPPTISRGKEDGQAVSTNINRGGGTLTDNPLMKVDKQSDKFSPQGKDSRHALRPVITRPKPSLKPMLLPRPTFQKPQPGKTEGGDMTSDQPQKDVAWQHPQLTTQPPPPEEPNLSNPYKRTVSGSTSSETSESTSLPSLQPRPTNSKISSRIQAIQSSLKQ
ncbi:TRIL [Branchiostoma lanceolatum]|uniref:TRIL protein n=1 Tax=Branchiostoma lanceolatum TaxID=7740 RepID=A0A8J9Z1E5_BRALA|nr:TRIL [Branchiostoma lanceolatum]